MTVTSLKKTIKIYCIIWCIVTTFFIILKRSGYNSYYEPMDIAQNLVYSKIDDKFEFTFEPNMKYVLVWTNPKIDPIVNLGQGLETVEERNCSISKCYVSSDRHYFDNITGFDVIVFHGPNINTYDLPKLRAPYQKYVFASMESADNYPLCNTRLNNFFNWTWTYKLNSDEEYKYISIRNKDKVIIGPKEEMQWMKIGEMTPIEEALKNKLSTKKLAAAWFVSHCDTPSKREIVATELVHELDKYNYTIDIYGRCGTEQCERYEMNTCLKMLETDYYFYLSFENSLSEDYVTEKLLHALQHYTVPVVFGGANYTRFMPDGIYLNARKLSIAELAKTMVELIEDKEKYYSYFRWHNHYSYHYVDESPETDPYCKLCSMIYDENQFENKSVYPNFIEWWNTNNKCI